MERIASFEQFKNNSGSMDEYNSDIESTNENNNDDRKHYMFFRNLASIKHNIEEILKMDPDQIDDMLENGHDWAADHIATSKDDIQEVTEWLRGEFDDEYDSDEDEDEEETDSDEEEEDEEPDSDEEAVEEPEEDETEEGETSKQQL
jgi:hypothetical protein